MGSQQNRRQFWQAHLQRCRASGMTLKAYAEQEGLTLSVFYGWNRRLKRKPAPEGSSFTRALVTSSPSTEYRLRFPNGLVLEWEGNPDTDCLMELVRQLA